jgi:Fe-S-cluster-containing dehydrogenase component
MAGPLVLLIDLERCTGCRACEVENRLGEGVFRNRVWWVASQDGHALEFVNAVCKQCERPACMRVCGAEALVKDDLGATLFLLGIAAHVVTTLLFAGYVAGGGPIYWRHLRR